MNANQTGSPSFEQSYLAGFGSVVMQVARDENFRSRLTKSAVLLATGVAIVLSGSMHEAKAQDNSLVHFAKNTIGVVVGGALGSQVGKGRGKTAGMVVGAAAGLWAAESLGGNNNQPTNQVNYQQSTHQSQAPTFYPGYHREQLRTIPNSGTRVVSREIARNPTLVSGSIALEESRYSKIASIENNYLLSRDKYARAQFASEQVKDDLMLSPHSKTVQQNNVSAQTDLRASERNYSTSKTEFVQVVEYFGHRGYDVHTFAHSYCLAFNNVTSKDMSHSDTTRAAQNAKQNYQHQSMDSNESSDYSSRM